MKYIHLSNIIEPSRDKYGPLLDFQEIQTYGLAEASRRAKEHQQRWLKNKKLARPLETTTYTVEQLAGMDMIGVYMPLDEWAMERAKEVAQRVTRYDTSNREGIDEKCRTVSFDVERLDRGLAAAGKRIDPEVVDILSKVATRLWLERYKPWTVTWGLHHGTLMSRDVGDPISCDSETEARSEFLNLKKDVARIGCQIWFAYLNKPDGTKELLEQNSYV